MPDVLHDLSPMAELLLRRMIVEPEKLRYDFQVFGGMFRDIDIERLDAAYRELEEAGLIERTGAIVMFSNSPKRIYRLSDLGRTVVELPS
jgi:DNA-binding HxlR family transcriptional regulator